MGCNQESYDSPLIKKVNYARNELQKNIYMLEVEKQELWNEYNRMKNSGNDEAARLKLANFNQVIKKLNEYNSQKAIVENDELKAKIAKGETKIISRLEDHAVDMKANMPEIQPEKYTKLGKKIDVKNKIYDQNNLRV